MTDLALSEIALLRDEHAQQRDDYAHRLEVQNLEIASLRMQLSTVQSLQRPNGSSRPIWQLGQHATPTGSVGPRSDLATSKPAECERQLRELAAACMAYEGEIGRLLTLQKMAAAEILELKTHNSMLQRALDRAHVQAQVAFARPQPTARSARSASVPRAPQQVSIFRSAVSESEAEGSSCLLQLEPSQIWRATGEKISLQRVPPAQRSRPLSAGTKHAMRNAGRATAAINASMVPMPLTNFKADSRAHAPSHASLVSCEVRAGGMEAASRENAHPAQPKLNLEPQTRICRTTAPLRPELVPRLGRHGQAHHTTESSHIGLRRSSTTSSDGCWPTAEQTAPEERCEMAGDLAPGAPAGACS